MAVASGVARGVGCRRVRQPGIAAGAAEVGGDGGVLAELVTALPALAGTPARAGLVGRRVAVDLDAAMAAGVLWQGHGSQKGISSSKSGTAAAGGAGGSVRGMPSAGALP